MYSYSRRQTSSGVAKTLTGATSAQQEQTCRAIAEAAEKLIEIIIYVIP